jgi:hypothetical protein
MRDIIFPIMLTLSTKIVNIVCRCKVNTMEKYKIRRTAGVLLLIQSLLIFVPMGIMGPVTGWPATVGDPGVKMLPVVAEHLGIVRLGYSMYLAYSILFLVTSNYALAAFSSAKDAVANPVTRVAMGAAAISTLARCIGIIRWLTAFPLLAGLYASASPESKIAIAREFDFMNAFAGGIGEIFGVGVFAAIWVFCFCFTSHLPKAFKVIGYFVGIIQMLAFIELLGIDLGPFASISGTAFHLWMLALAIHTLITNKKGAKENE